MRKILFLLILIFTSSVNAQTFDEVMLSGTWKVENITGNLPLGITNFEELVLEETTFYENDYYDYWMVVPGVIKGIVETNNASGASSTPQDRYLLDFFISNGNKLHIIADDAYSFRFIIDELTNTSLVLKTYKGDCTIRLQKDVTTRVVNVEQNKKRTSSYDIKGRKIVNEQSTGFYIKNGSKFLK